MDQHVARRFVRFIRSLTVRGLCLACGCLLLCLPALSQFKLSGYFAAQYENGEIESKFPEGTFGGVQAGLIFSGRTANIFDYSLEVRFKSETRVEVEEAWVGVNPSAAFHLRLGFFLVPFGKTNPANRPHQTPYIQPPLSLEALYPPSWREVGLLAEGQWDFIGYAAYVGNGLAEGEDMQAGQQFRDNNGDLAAGSRLSFFLSRSFEVGISYYKGNYDDAGVRALKLQGADVSWKTEAFLALYEYGKAELENPAGYEQGLVKGHFFLASFVLGEFSSLVSYQTLDYRDPYHGPGFAGLDFPGAGISAEISRWAVGLVFSPSSAFLFKVEYDLNREKGLELKNDVLAVQVALQF
ncbi:MAG: hypothetical protein AB1715_03430 [Acidobacteriota bacterium]